MTDLYLDIDSDAAAREALALYVELIDDTDPARAQAIRVAVGRASSVAECADRGSRKRSRRAAKIKARAAAYREAMTNSDGVLVVPPRCEHPRTEDVPGIKTVSVQGGVRRHGGVRSSKR